MAHQDREVFQAATEQRVTGDSQEAQACQELRANQALLDIQVKRESLVMLFQSTGVEVEETRASLASLALEGFQDRQDCQGLSGLLGQEVMRAVQDLQVHQDQRETWD